MGRFEDEVRPSRVALIAKLVGIVAVVITALSIFGGSWYTVSAGYMGVLTRNGAVVGTATPGLGFKLPFIDGARDISVQSHLIRYTGAEGKGLSTYTADNQQADVIISVNYRIPATPDDVIRVYSDYGGEDGVEARILTPHVAKGMKTVFGTYTAPSAIKDRAKLNTDIEETIRRSVVGLPILIDSVQIENIDFSDAYEAVAEQRSQAEINVLKQRQLLEKEKIDAEITVTKAKAEADSNLAIAKAKATATQLAGEAEATAINAKGKALKDNPALVDLIKAERWNGSLPTTMVPGSTVPFMNVGQ